MDVIGTLEGRQDYTIHGELYSQLYFSLPENPEDIQQCRLPIDAFDNDLKPGDRIRITFLLKTVMEIRHAE
jgi:hypothetical protein